MNMNQNTALSMPILQNLMDNGNISSSEVSELVIKLMRINEVKKKYEDRIKSRKDGRQFYIYLNRTQITAGSYDALIEKLYEIEYGKLQSTLADLYPKWLIWRRDYTSVSSKTLKEYTYVWNSFFENDSIKDVPLSDLKTKDFTNLFRKWTKDRTITKKRFANAKSLLNGIYDYAIEEEIVQHNPVNDVNCRQFAFKPVNNSNDVFTIEERQKLLDYLKDNDEIYSLAIQLDFHLVLRIGELTALKWDDIENGNIHIQSQQVMHAKLNDDLSFSSREFVNTDHIKGNTDEGFRYQPISPKAHEILERVRKINPDGRYIFMKDGRQLITDTFNEYLRRYCAKIGIKGRSSHKIRFTVVSMLYQNGMPLTSLQKLLGHTTAAMTLHYLRQIVPSEETAEIMFSALG